MKNLEVTLQVRNNGLKERRLALQMSQPEFADAVKISLWQYRDLECMRDSPKRGDEWRDIALSVAAFHCVEPEELWPETVLAMKVTKAVAKVDVGDLYPLLSDHHEMLTLSPDVLHSQVELRAKIEGLLATLTPRQEKVIRMRFGLNADGVDHTIKEVGKQVPSLGTWDGTGKGDSIGKERARQIENKALCLLRHPSRSGRLAGYDQDT